MKNLPTPVVKLICLLLLVTVRHANAQDSATIQRAMDGFTKGWNAYNNKNYTAALGFLKVSNQAIHTAITYYFLALTYSKLFKFKEAYDAVNAALGWHNPSLPASYLNDANTLKDRLYDEVYPPPPPPRKEGVTAAAIKILPSGKMPSISDYPY